MSQDMRVALITSLQDRLVAPLRRSLDEIEKDFKNLERTVQGVTQASRQADQQMAGMRGPQEAAKQAEKLGRDTERATQLAGRLQAAWSAAGNTIRAVTAAAAVAGAVAAVRSSTAPALGAARSYEYALASAANTAYAGQSVDARRAGMGALDAAVRQSVQAGGGSRDDALAALNSMIGSGTVEVGAATRMLPMIQRAATGAGASAEQMASIVVRALQNGFSEADIPLLLDKALAAGQAGGFELRDMAKWLPQILAIAGQSGMRGPRDIDRLLAATQASVITAGTRDEAGNNLVNLLGKINSQDTAADAKKLGVDLAGSLAAARARGVDSLSAFTNLASQIAGGDPRFVAARRAAQTAGSDGERKAALESQAAILQGSAIGKIVQDRQALMALIAIMNNGQYMDSVQQRLAGARGANDSNMALLEQMPFFQTQRSGEMKLFTQGDALKGVNEALGKLADTTTSLREEYPLLAQAMELAKFAMYALAAGATAATGALVVLGSLARRFPGGSPPTVPGTPGMPGTPSPPGGTPGPAGKTLPGLAAAALPAVVAAAVPALVLGAGVALSEQANSAQGLQSRIAARKARLAELTELSTLDPAGASRYQAEISALKANLAQLEARLGSRADVQGVQERIATRDARLAEMIDRSALSATGGWYTGGNSAAKGNPAEQPSLLGTPAGGGRNPEVSVNVYLDGQQIQDAVNRRNTMDARRN